MDVSAAFSPDGEEVYIECNGVRGVFILNSVCVQCRCSGCIRRPSNQTRNLSPTEFERHAGMEATKKWRVSIRVTEGPRGPTLMSIGKFLEMQGFKVPPRSAALIANNAVADEPQNGGYQQAPQQPQYMGQQGGYSGAGQGGWQYNEDAGEGGYEQFGDQQQYTGGRYGGTEEGSGDGDAPAATKGGGGGMSFKERLLASFKSKSVGHEPAHQQQPEDQDEADEQQQGADEGTPAEPNLLASDDQQGLRVSKHEKQSAQQQSPAPVKAEDNGIDESENLLASAELRANSHRMRAQGYSPISRGAGSPSYRNLNAFRVAPAIPAVAPPGVAGVPVSPAAAGHSPQPFGRIASASTIAPPGVAAPQPSGASSGPHRLAAGQALQPLMAAALQQAQGEGGSNTGGSNTGTGGAQPMNAATALAKLRAARAAGDPSSPLQQQAGGPSMQQQQQQPTLSASRAAAPAPRTGTKRGRAPEDDDQEEIVIEDEEEEDQEPDARAAGRGAAGRGGHTNSNATSMGSMGAGGGAGKHGGNGAVSPPSRPRPKGSSGTGPTGSTGVPSGKTTATPLMAGAAGGLAPGVAGVRPLGGLGGLPPGAALLPGGVGAAGLAPGLFAPGLSAAPQAALIPGLGGVAIPGLAPGMALAPGLIPGLAPGLVPLTLLPTPAGLVQFDPTKPLHQQNIPPEKLAILQQQQILALQQQQQQLLAAAGLARPNQLMLLQPGLPGVLPGQVLAGGAEPPGKHAVDKAVEELKARHNQGLVALQRLHAQQQEVERLQRQYSQEQHSQQAQVERLQRQQSQYQQQMTSIAIQQMQVQQQAAALAAARAASSGSLGLAPGSLALAGMPGMPGLTSMASMQGVAYPMAAAAAPSGSVVPPGKSGKGLGGLSGAMASGVGSKAGAGGPAASSARSGALPASRQLPPQFSKQQHSRVPARARGKRRHSSDEDEDYTGEGSAEDGYDDEDDGGDDEDALMARNRRNAAVRRSRSDIAMRDDDTDPDWGGPGGAGREVNFGDDEFGGEGYVGGGAGLMRIAGKGRGDGPSGGGGNPLLAGGGIAPFAVNDAALGAARKILEEPSSDEEDLYQRGHEDDEDDDHRRAGDRRMRKPITEDLLLAAQAPFVVLDVANVSGSRAVVKAASPFGTWEGVLTAVT